jgi:xylan 1,4-beta-xylosidase
VIANPVIPGFNPDPSIIRVDGDYYIATSTFEWLPAVQLHHSTDLQHWELIGHVLGGQTSPHLRGVHPSGGVWAPSLSHDRATGIFSVVFSVMRNQTGEQFDVSNHLVTATDIRGPWGPPVYLNSVGFDASLFHDEDGRTWLVTLEWDPRDGYEHPGALVLEEYDPVARALTGPARRISRGSTDRGCLEAPHLFRRNGWYYLMTAEGGTGFGHSVALARSRSIDGPYEPAPGNPVITSSPTPYSARGDRDFLRPHLFDPGSELQKAGHGSIVETPDGEWYVAHLSARPLPGTLRSVLGRETSLQKVAWTPDGWLELASGGNRAGSVTEGPTGAPAPAVPAPSPVVHDDFDGPELGVHLSTLRSPAHADWADLASRPGHLRLAGRDSLFSRFDVSLVASRLQAFRATATTVVEFDPQHFSHAAGLTVFYDDANWFYLRIYLSETLGRRALGVLEADGGRRREHLGDRVALPDGPIVLRSDIDRGSLQFSWHRPGEAPMPIGAVLDASRLADEPLRGFTGTMVGITCQDAFRRTAAADFDWFRLEHHREELEHHRESHVGLGGVTLREG